MIDTIEFKPPLEELVLIFPDQRKKLFVNLVENLKIFCPNLTLRYGVMNYDSTLKLDYLLIFSVEQNGKELVLWTTPFIYTALSLPGYRYAIKQNIHETYFNYMMSRLCQMPLKDFKGFIQSHLCGNLSWRVKDPNYWQSANNAPTLMKGMADLGLQYVPAGFRNTGRRTVD